MRLWVPRRCPFGPGRLQNDRKASSYCRKAVKPRRHLWDIRRDSTAAGISGATIRDSGLNAAGKRRQEGPKKLTGFQVRRAGGRCGLQDGPGPRHSPVVPQQSHKPHALHRPYPVLQERSLTPCKPGPCRRKTPRSRYLQNAPKPCGRQCEPLLFCGQDLAQLAIDKPRSEVAVFGTSQAIEGSERLAGGRCIRKQKPIQGQGTNNRVPRVTAVLKSANLIVF